MNPKEDTAASEAAAQDASSSQIEHGATVFAIPTRGGVPLPAYDVIWPEKRIFIVVGVATVGPVGLQMAPATQAVLPQLQGLIESPSFTIAYSPTAESFWTDLAELRGKADDGAQFLMLLPDFELASSVVLQLGVQRPPSIAIH